MKLSSLALSMLLAVPALADSVQNATDLIVSPYAPSDYSAPDLPALQASMSGMQKTLQSDAIAPLRTAMNQQTLLAHHGALSTATAQPAIPGRPSHPSPRSGTVYLTSCQAITQPGHYVVSQDLVGTSGCFTIHDTQNVDLDCQGSSLSSKSIDYVVTVSHVSHFTMTNCSIQANFFPGLTIDQSDHVQITGNQLDKVDVTATSHASLTNNTIAGYYQEYHSSFTLLSNNTIQGPHDTNVAATVLSYGGAHNVIRNNQIDGGWDGSTGVGADDGIILDNETNDDIRGNTVTNAYGTGIETSDLFNHSVISDNHISHTFFAGIGSYDESNWTGNTVENNTVEDSTALFIFKYNHTGTAPVMDYFKDNQINGNVFRSPKKDLGNYLYSVFIDVVTAAGKQPVTAGNNTFANNDFGQIALAPFVDPPSAVINGGGNVCPLAATAAICSTP